MPYSYFLAKTDPSDYPVSRFAADGRTLWDGVANAQAVQAIRAMRPGDWVFIYHSGGESAVVGLAKVAGQPRQDEANPKLWAVEMEFAGVIEPPITLAGIKASGLFTDWALVRQSRLSTMAAPESFAKWIRAQRPKLKF
ncbi:MAG TPA: EVE domain-containing protein [Bryobacteraceae bacterium]|nr:EVE domain-containing protein [Bryobacteraceae bacterium]